MLSPLHFSCCTSQEFPVREVPRNTGEETFSANVETPETADVPKPPESAEVPGRLPIPEAQEPPLPPEPDYAVFVAFGDNLFHDPMIKPGENGYEFEAIFSTMDFWDTVPGTTVLGIHRSEEKRRFLWS